MNFVDQMHAFIFKIMMRNNQEIEQRTKNIAGTSDQGMVEDAARIRKLSDQNEIWTMIAKQLADQENEQTKAIMRGNG